MPSSQQPANRHTERTPSHRQMSPHPRRSNPQGTGQFQASRGYAYTNRGNDSLDGTTATLSTRKKRRVRSNGGIGYRSAATARGRKSHRRPSHVSPRRGLPTWSIVVIAVAVVGVLVGGFFVIRNLVNGSGAHGQDGSMVTVVIPEGSNGNDIIDILLDVGVIRSKRDFRNAVKEQNADQSLRSGAYSFAVGSDPNDVVRQLVVGPNSVEGQLQVPEGLTVEQTAELVYSVLGIKQADFMQQAKASNYVDDFPFLKDAGNNSLEGFLYPKTYDFAGKEINADTVIRMMLTQFEAEVQSMNTQAALKKLADRYNLNVTAYDVLKIASIIEEEAITAEDRPKVSSVFYNRLSIGMALQSDATMGYVTNGVISSDDLTTDSPYNTYMYKGLPPTPICNPSLWAIQAALEPADTTYKFFFIIESDNYSNHTFSETYEEHDEAYKAAKKAQAEAEGEPVPVFEDEVATEGEED